jgi:plasmid stabilization system protein ParE
VLDANYPPNFQHLIFSINCVLFPACHRAPGTLDHSARYQLTFKCFKMEDMMPRGDKSKYTGKQRRKAEHIEEGYKSRGVSVDEAERRAWATVNKESGGGKKSGSGRGRRETHVSSRKGGRLGGKAAAARPAAARSRSAQKAAATRRRRAGA